MKKVHIVMELVVHAVKEKRLLKWKDFVLISENVCDSMKSGRYWCGDVV